MRRPFRVPKGDKIPVEKRSKLVINFSDSYSSDDDIGEIQQIETKQTYSARMHTTSSSSEDEGTDEPFFAAPPVKSAPTAPVILEKPMEPIVKAPQPLAMRMLTRYKTAPVPSTVRAVSAFARYSCFRTRKGAKRIFQLIDEGKSSVVAGAEFGNNFGNTINISNSRGLIGEIKVKSKSFQLLFGQDLWAKVTNKKGAISMNFFTVDDSAPPYDVITSTDISDLQEAFGGRTVVQSVKNCKLCDALGNEVIAIRKVSKHELSIDSRRNLSFLAPFTLAMYMFVMT